MKKTFVLLLTLTLLFVAVIAPVSASAASYVTAKDSDFARKSNGNFSYCGTASYVIIPDTIKGVAVTNYDFMFASASWVKGVRADNPNIVSTVGMFSNNQSSALDIDIDTSNVKNMTSMFLGAKATTINFGSRFDVSKCENMAFMFAWSGVQTLDLSSWDTSNAINMYAMFQAAKATTLKLNFNTSKTEQMGYMFYQSKVAALDLSSFQVIKGAVTDYMFEDSAITTAYARTQADADKLNSTGNKPVGLTFVVK